MRVRGQQFTPEEHGDNAEAEAALHRKVAEDLRAVSECSVLERLSEIEAEAEWHVIASPSAQTFFFRLVPERVRRLASLNDPVTEAELLASVLEKEAERLETLASVCRQVAFL